MSVTFWTLAPVMVLAGLGMLVVRKAVHAAMLLAVIMISLGIMYLTLDAPFLAVAQILVYTGAILMLFLFVLMLVGVDTADAVAETIKGQRVLAIVLGLALGSVLVVALSQITVSGMAGLEEANEPGNIQAVANFLFSDYVFAFEVTSALLITAALGAMVLAHRERTGARVTQKAVALQRMREYAEEGRPLGPLPSPGTFARHNAVDTPALLPDGTAAPASISRVLAAQGNVRSVEEFRDDIAETVVEPVEEEKP